MINMWQLSGTFWMCYSTYYNKWNLYINAANLLQYKWQMCVSQFIFISLLNVNQRTLLIQSKLYVWMSARVNGVISHVVFLILEFNDHFQVYTSPWPIADYFQVINTCIHALLTSFYIQAQVPLKTRTHIFYPLRR